MTRPRLKRDVDYRPGLAAVALFVVMAAAFVNVQFPAPGFQENASFVASIGAALFGVDATVVAGDGAIPAEGFLGALIILAVLLDAALDGSLMLAKRDDEVSEE
jgi:NADH-quinone oxidoreductase subunit J